MGDSCPLPLPKNPVESLVGEDRMLGGSGRNSKSKTVRGKLTPPRDSSQNSRSRSFRGRGSLPVVQEEMGKSEGTFWE